ncbi:MAG TPA: hypothetical protein VGM54_02170 [Chthoniobacter sp.]|jgi:hypothetical protein
MTPAEIETTAAAYRDWLQHRDPSRLEHLSARGRWETSQTPVFDLGYVCRIARPSPQTPAPEKKS